MTTVSSYCTLVFDCRKVASLTTTVKEVGREVVLSAQDNAYHMPRKRVERQNELLQDVAEIKKKRCLGKYQTFLGTALHMKRDNS